MKTPSHKPLKEAFTSAAFTLTCATAHSVLFVLASGIPVAITVGVTSALTGIDFYSTLKNKKS